MKFLDEFRDGETVAKLVRAIERRVTRPWTIMEVCGGQTHTIVKYGTAAQQIAHEGRRGRRFAHAISAATAFRRP